MDFSLKETLGVLLAILVCGMVLISLFSFGLFDKIGNVIEGVV